MACSTLAFLKQEPAHESDPDSDSHPNRYADSYVSSGSTYRGA